MPLIESVRMRLPHRYRELAKFITVGGTTWIIDAGLFTLLSHTVLNEKVIMSKVISTLVSTIVSYVLNREWSFSARGGRERHHEAMLFFVVNGVALLVNLLPLWVSHYPMGFNTDHHSRAVVSIADFVSANVVGTLLAMIFRYWAYRRYVFPDEIAHVGEDDSHLEPHSLEAGLRGIEDSTD